MVEPKDLAWEPGVCPDPGSIAAYVDGTLSESERDDLHRHLAACDSCTELVAETVAASDAAFAPAASQPEPVEQLAPRSPLRFFQRHRVAMMSTVLAAAAALALVVRVLQPHDAGEMSPPSPAAIRGGNSPADPSVMALAAALGTTRPVEGRLTGGFTYGEVRTPDRSLAPSENLSLVAAAGEIQKRVNADPSPANLHAWGVAQLLVGRSDASVETLESVWMQQRHDPRVAADLGTARLARAGALDAPEDLPRALEAIEQALTLDPNLAEAWFTKAIVLERLQIRQQAREAWVKYLQLDPDSSWSAEARVRLAALDSSTMLKPWTEIERALRDPAVDQGVVREAVSRDPMEVRELVVRELLPHWAAAAGSASGAARLDHAQRIVEALEQPGPDHSLAAAITDIRGAGAARRRSTLFASVHRGIVVGRTPSMGCTTRSSASPPPACRRASGRPSRCSGRCNWIRGFAGSRVRGARVRQAVIVRGNQPWDLRALPLSTSGLAEPRAREPRAREPRAREPRAREPRARGSEVFVSEVI
jgi:tetratricopeptide (TPR) repeat protein